jgi:hypothetical protein
MTPENPTDARKKAMKEMRDHVKGVIRHAKGILKSLEKLDRAESQARPPG